MHAGDGWGVDVRQRPDNKWQVVWTDVDPTLDSGWYERDAWLCESRGTAEKKAARLIAMFEDGALGPSDVDRVVVAANDD